MKRGLLFIVGLAILGMSGSAVHEASGQKKDEKKVDAQPAERVFELRTYWAYPGKMKDLEARFRDHTCKLFEKHGMTFVGFWRPIGDSKKTVEQKTQVEVADAEYKAAKVKLAEAEYTQAAERIRTRKFGSKVMEKDEVNAQREKENKRDALAAAMHEQGNADDHKLIYILAFPSKEAAAKSWEAFRKDPDWIAARKESEKNGELVLKVESVFMKATAFSPMK